MIVAGFGFRSAATCASLRAAFDLAAAGHDVTTLAAPLDKAHADVMTQLAGQLGLPVIPVADDDMRAARTLTHSAQSRKHRDTGSVAEAAALAAAGPGARLVSPRHISEDRQATCAVAIRGPS